MFRWLVLGFLYSIVAYGQGDGYNMTSYGRLNGIPPMKIKEMASDSSGHLWLISNLGLHKFNGHGIRSYSELSNSLITDVQVRSDGKVFAAIMDIGLAVYNPARDSFLVYDDSDFFTVNAGRAFNIAFGPNLEIYAAHNGIGVAQFHMDDGEYELLLKRNYINSITVDDSTGDLILGADSIFRYSPEGADLKVLLPLRTTEVYASEGILYYSHYFTNEVGWLNLSGNKLSKRVYVGDDYVDIIKKNGNVLWVSSGNELVRVSIRDAVIESRTTVDDYITGLHVDSQGRLWIAYDNKLHALDPLNQAFSPIKSTETFFYQDMISIGDEEMFCIPFDLREFHVLNTQNQRINVLPFPSSLDHMHTAFSMRMMGDSVWIAFVDGLAIYDISRRRIEPILLNKGADYFQKKQKRAIVAAQVPYMYISTNTEDVIYRINTRTLVADSMHIEPYLSLQSALALPSGLRMPGMDGLVDIDFVSRKWNKYPYKVNHDLSVPQDLISVNDTLWLAAGSDVYKGILSQGALQLSDAFENEVGRRYSEYLDIAATPNNELAILSSSELKLFNPYTKRIYSYSVDEGLKKINRKSKAVSHGDNIYIIGDGIYSGKFHHMSRMNQKLPATIIKSFLVNGKFTEKSVFPAAENDVKITFESTDLSRPLDVQYRYKIESEREWQYGNYNDREVYFPALKPGDYLFQVSAKHKFSDWGKASEYGFAIKAPYWQQAWFIMSLLFLIALIAYLTARFRIKEARKMAGIRSRMAELENEALRAQMNPHFIFNSLNSVKAFIIDHDREAAADYLTNFSELIRLILANSREKFIPLSKELYTLKLYMDIENIRLEDKFTYSIDNTVRDLDIQPLTLQPFIENAIWHGIVHKEEQGHISIVVREEKELVKISILDDGVGRIKSQQVSRNRAGKRSYGILITKERLRNSSANDSVYIEDLYDDKSEAAGTKVTLTIKKDHV